MANQPGWPRPCLGERKPIWDTIRKTFLVACMSIILASVVFAQTISKNTEQAFLPNDTISVSLARSIAEHQSRKYFGLRSLFDVETYFDEDNQVSAYVFIFRNSRLTETKQDLILRLKAYQKGLKEAQNQIKSARMDKDRNLTRHSDEMIRKFSHLLHQDVDYFSIYVSASKTHMPIFEWRCGLPESYTALPLIESWCLSRGISSMGTTRFLYFGPFRVLAQVKDRIGADHFLKITETLNEIPKSSLTGIHFRRNQDNTQDQRRMKIEQAWNFYQNPKSSMTAATVETAGQHLLDRVPDFIQTSYEDLIGTGTCSVMAAADVLGYYDQDHTSLGLGYFWNLVDFAWYQAFGGTDFYRWTDGENWQLSLTDEFIVDIADAIGYQHDVGTPRAGVEQGLLNFTNSSLYGNGSNLSFRIDANLTGGCSYETLVSEIDNHRPLIVSVQPVPGYPAEPNAHSVAVIGYGDSAGLSEPVYVLLNNGMKAWWDYADLDNLASWIVIPGGSAGSLLSAPIPTSPASGTILSNPAPTLSWSAVDGANYYQIQVSTNPDFSGNSYYYGSLLSTFTFSSGLTNQTYFWRVVARNSTNNFCQFGPSSSFTVNASGQVIFLTSTDVLSVPEGGTNTFKVRLSSIPPQSVSVSISRVSGDSDISISQNANFTFTATNWNIWKTISVSALQDVDVTNGSAVLRIIGGGISNRDVTAVEQDDDMLNFYTGGWAVWEIEEGQEKECGVRLTAQPTSAVTATVTKTGGDPDISIISGSTLTFTTSDWNAWHYIKLYAAPDLDAVDGTATLKISAPGVADHYQNLGEMDVDELWFDIEGGATSISVPEGGTGTFRVRLTAQPQSTTIVSVYNLSGDSDISVASGYQLVFTTSNYSTYQSVTLAASEDADAANGSATIRIQDDGPISGKSISAIEQDNDSLSFATSRDTVIVTENGQNNVLLRLTAQPLSDVQVTVAWLSGDTDLRLQSGSALTFTSANWDQYQSIVLTAADDSDSINGQAVFRISATAFPNYDFTAIEEDDDPSPPPIPATISYPSNSYSGSYPVDWDNSLGATSYGLERSANSGETWIGIYSGSSSSYTESVGNGSYRYRVKASNAAGASDWKTGSIDCVVNIPSAPPVPGSITYPASSSTGTYTVSWGTSTVATSYNLQRSADAGASWAPVYSGSGTSYAESVGNGSYRYRVQATNTAGSSGWRTGSVDCVVNIPSAPPVPGSITYPASSSTGTYTVSWGTSTGATSYNLQRSADAGASWAPVYSGSGTSYAESVGNGSYRYRVQATNTAGSSGWRTGSVDCVVNIPGAPPVPGSITYPASSSTGTYTVSWGTSTGATSYNLQRSADAGASWAPVYSGSGTSYAESVGNGSYRYRVQATNTAGSSGWRTGAHDCIVAAPLGIRVISPNGGEYWGRGTKRIITWSSKGEMGSAVRIQLYRGAALLKILTSAVPISAGSFAWTIPGLTPLGSEYSIRITSTSNASYSDASDAPFRIVADSITVVSPAGGELWTMGAPMTVAWTFKGKPGTQVKIELLKGGSVREMITAGTPLGATGKGSFSWLVTSDQVFGRDYRIQVSSTTNSAIFGMSMADFTIHTGRVSSWGSNLRGELGDGTLNAATVPVSIDMLDGVRALTGGKNFSLALRADGTVRSWGANDKGQLGNGATMDRLLPGPVSGLTGIASVAAGRSFALALRSTGLIASWGENASGQLGNGNVTNRSVPGAVIGLVKFKAIAAGAMHAAAIAADGTVRTWGSNSYGQLGIGTTGSIRKNPVKALNITGALGVAAGAGYTAALKKDGTVWVWGDGAFGQLGNGASVRSSKAVRAAVTGVRAIAGGAFHVVTVKSDGTVWSWGLNDKGQLGNGTQINSSLPVQASGLSGAVAVAAGEKFTIVLKSNGSVWAWGANVVGQLGIGSTLDSSTPVHVGDLIDIVSVAAGFTHALALR